MKHPAPVAPIRLSAPSPAERGKARDAVLLILPPHAGEGARRADGGNLAPARHTQPNEKR
jgi:hypothetical protein